MLNQALVGRIAHVEKLVELCRIRRAVTGLGKIAFALIEQDDGAFLRRGSNPDKVDVAIAIDVTRDHVTVVFSPSCEPYPLTTQIPESNAEPLFDAI